MHALLESRLQIQMDKLIRDYKYEKDTIFEKNIMPSQIMNEINNVKMEQHQVGQQCNFHILHYVYMMINSIRILF